MAAPKWEVGDIWTFRDAAGDERTDTVTGVEGDRWRLESTRKGGKTVLLVDSALVIRKLIEPNGTEVNQPVPTPWGALGGKSVDFPLQGGKMWSYPYTLNRITYSWSQRVVGCEEVTTTAGPFPAVKIEVTDNRADGKWQGVVYTFYAPAVKRSVRGQFQRPAFPATVLD